LPAHARILDERPVACAESAHHRFARAAKRSRSAAEIRTNLGLERLEGQQQVGGDLGQR
jgi:hypothetical protein